MSCDEEALSEYLDGELAPGRRAAVEAHLASCPACAGVLERLKAGSAAFRAHGAAKAPAGLAGKVLDRPMRESSGREMRWLQPLMIGALSLGVFLSSGKMFKPQIFGIYNQIMGMISGAASSVGSDGGSLPPLPSSPPSDMAGGLLALGLFLLAVVLSFVMWRRRQAAPGAGAGAGGREGVEALRAAVIFAVCVLAFLAASAFLYRPVLVAVLNQVMSAVSGAASMTGR